MAIETDLFLVLDYFGLKSDEVKGADRFLKCVFHADKTASLSCHKEKGFKCFGCDAKGGAVDFIAQYLKVDNKEAFKTYCQIANIPFNKDYNYKTKDIKSNYETLSFPAKVLANCEKLKEPTEYLKKRGITKLYNVPIYILVRDFRDTIEGKEEKIYKGALIVPIYNKKGTLISIQYIYETKKIEGKDNFKGFLYKHKYSSPNNHGFCNFFINDNKQFFLVEGVFDALSLNMAGFNAVWCINAEGLVECALTNYDNWMHKGYVFADNDEVGIEKATKASNVLNTSCLKSADKDLKDANDILKAKGEKYLQKLVNNFLENNYLSTISFLIKTGKLKLFYNKFDDKYIASLMNEILAHKNKANLGYQILNKLQKEKIVFYKTTDIERIAGTIGKFIALNCIMVDDVNYHPKHQFFTSYSDNDSTYLNVYKSSGLHARSDLKPLAFPNIYKHLIHITGLQYYADWLIKLLAWKWQKPYVKYAYIPIFIGKQGTGKGLFAELLALLFGSNTNKDVSNIDFEDKFNSAFENKLVCICDEVITAENRMKAYHKIKALTGSTTFALENKQIKKKNRYHNFNTIILISNNEYVYPVEGDDDRRAVVFKQYERLEDHHYTIMDDMVKEKAHKEELEGFAYHLANLKLENNLEILKTEAREDLKELSKSHIEEFIEELSANYEDVISEINHLFKLDLPIVNNTGADFLRPKDSKNGFYIEIKDDVLLISTNMFLLMFNKKYSSSAKNNKFVYSSARKNPKFSYEPNDRNYLVYENRKNIKVVKIELKTSI